MEYSYGKNAERPLDTVEPTRLLVSPSSQTKSPTLLTGPTDPEVFSIAK